MRSPSLHLALLASLLLPACTLEEGEVYVTDDPADVGSPDDPDPDDVLGEEPTGDDADDELPSTIAAPGPGGYLSLYDYRGFRGRNLLFRDEDRNLVDNYFNDRASSLVNKTDRFWIVFEHIRYAGGFRCIKPRSHVSRLRRHGFNNTISSVFPAANSTAFALCASFIGAPN